MNKAWWIALFALAVMLLFWAIRSNPNPAATDPPTQGSGTLDEPRTHPAFPAVPIPPARPEQTETIPPGCLPAKETLQRGEATDMIMLVFDLLQQGGCPKEALVRLFKDAAGAQDEKLRDAAVTGLEQVARASCLEQAQRQRKACPDLMPDVAKATACLQEANAQGTRTCVADFFETERLTATRLDHQARKLEPHCTLGLRGEWDEARGRTIAEVDEEIGADPVRRTNAEDVRALVTHVSLPLCEGVLETIDPRFSPWRQLRLPGQDEFVRRYIIPWLNAYALQDRAASPDDAQRAAREEVGAAWGLTRTGGLWTLPTR